MAIKIIALQIMFFFPMYKVPLTSDSILHIWCKFLTRILNSVLSKIFWPLVNYETDELFRTLLFEGQQKKSFRRVII